jgi:transposase
MAEAAGKTNPDPTKYRRPGSKQATVISGTSPRKKPSRRPSFARKAAATVRIDGLAAQVQTVLKADLCSGHLFLFRGKRGDLLKALWWDGQGLVLLAKRLEKGRFLRPTIAREGVVTLTTAQLAMLLEGLDWRTPTPSWKPEIAV